MNEIDLTELMLVMELDAASGTTYVRGKDGRLYRQRDVGDLQARALAGDAAARSALTVVAFAVDDAGAKVTERAAMAAMAANRDAWTRGAFDHLRAVGELAPGRRAPRWMRTGRDRRERAAAARRDRRMNSSIMPAPQVTLAMMLPNTGGGLLAMDVGASELFEAADWDVVVQSAPRS